MPMNFDLQYDIDPRTWPRYGQDEPVCQVSRFWHRHFISDSHFYRKLL